MFMINNIGKSLMGGIKNKDKLEIIEIVKDYDWEYKPHVISDILASEDPSVVFRDKDGCPTQKIYKVLNDKDGNRVGFYILQKYRRNWKKIEIMYLFIKPEYRGRGYASRIIRSIQVKSNNIYTDSKDQVFIKIISKLGFRYIGKCRNGVEDCFHYGEEEEEDKTGRVSAR